MKNFKWKLLISKEHQWFIHLNVIPVYCVISFCPIRYPHTASYLHVYCLSFILFSVVSVFTSFFLFYASAFLILSVNFPLCCFPFSLCSGSVTALPFSSDIAQPTYILSSSVMLLTCIWICFYLCSSLVLK